MCATCGCSGAHGHDHPHARPTRSARAVRFEHELLAKNAGLAAANRRELAARGIALFNLIGAPGAGKTALLEALVRVLRTSDVDVTVIEGDQATDRDARRIEAAGCDVLQINTGTGCHLDAAMVASGLRALRPAAESLVFVENVGNLVCPALFDLGERSKVVVMSVTEGEDKPLKYPHVFRSADLCVLTKTDLQPHVRFDEDAYVRYARQVHPEIRTLRASALRGDGIDELCAWFRARARAGSELPR